MNVSVVDRIGSEILGRVPQIAASTGAACHEGGVRISPVLAAMGVPPEIARGALRLSVGRFTGETDIDAAGTCLIEAMDESPMERPGDLGPALAAGAVVRCVAERIQRKERSGAL